MSWWVQAIVFAAAFMVVDTVRERALHRRYTGYRPTWQPAVRSNEDTGDVRVVIQKPPSPRQRDLPKAALEIGVVRITDQDFEAKLQALVATAEDRAAAMTAAQSTTRQYA